MFPMADKIEQGGEEAFEELSVEYVAKTRQGPHAACMAHMLEDLYVPVEVLGCIASHFDAAATLLAFDVELSVDGEMTHSWTGPYWESGQGEGGAAPRLWPGEPPPWFRPFIAISKDNDHLVSRDGAEGWAVPAALAEAYTCTVTVTHALRSARLYSGRPSLVCASRDDCVVFDERRLPPLFSPPDP
uniref:Uncharacterized protein n=2 Tax=Emiliania huxleyi TaxID=2903 RepID=A0A0D3IF81_EMIH1